MIYKWLAVAILIAGVMAHGFAEVAPQAPTEAPTGFDTPTLAQNSGSQSISNGIAEPPGDTYALDQTRSRKTTMPAPGLAQYSMPEPARIAIRIPSVGDQASSRRSARDTWMPTAILLPPPCPSTTERTLSPSALSSTTAHLSRKLRSMYPIPKTLEPCAPLSTL